MLQGNESSIQVIQVHYVHSLGYFHELTLQFVQGEWCSRIPRHDISLHLLMVAV